MFRLFENGKATTDVASGHDGGERARDVHNDVVTDPRGGSVLAREDGSGVDRLALSVDVRMSFREGLERGKPLESGGGRGSGVEDEDLGLTGEDDDDFAAFDRIGA